MSTMEIKLAERLKELMQEKGVNQKQLSEKIGIKQGRISKWLSGENYPSLENLWKLADYFDVSLDILTGRTEY